MSQYCFVRTLALRQMEFLRMMLLFNKAKHPESAHRGVLIVYNVQYPWCDQQRDLRMDERKLGWETCRCQVGALAVQPLSSRWLWLLLLCYPSQRLWKMMKPKAVGPQKPPAPTDPTAVGNASKPGSQRSTNQARTCLIWQPHQAFHRRTNAND